MSSAPLKILALNKTYLVDQLRARGHTVITAAVCHNFSLARAEMTSQRRFDLPFEEGIALPELLNRLPPDFQPDRIVYFDDSNPTFYIGGLEDAQVPTLFFSVDAHIHHIWHPVFAAVFDKVLVAQKDYLPEFLERNQNVEWFPLWAAAILEPREPKTIDVCFRGSLDPANRRERIEFLQRLAKRVPVNMAWADYIASFPVSKIVLNETLKGDVNFRIFESMMSGGLLLTPDTGNGLKDLFVPGEHLAVYKEHDECDAADKIEYYLSHDEERAAVARKGREEVLRSHTAEVRAGQLEEHLYGLQVTPRKQKYCGAAYLALIDARLTIRRRSLESTNRLMTAVKALSTAANTRELPSDSLLLAYVTCRTMLQQGGHQESINHLSGLMYEAYPSQGAFCLGWIDCLLKLGKRDEALKAAAGFASDPQAIVEQAPSLLKNLEAQINLTPD